MAVFQGGLEARLTFGLDEVGEAVELLAELMEQRAGDEVDQAVFDRGGTQAYLVAAQQAGLTEDVALAEAVVQFAATPVDFHRAAAHVMQLVDRRTDGEDFATGLEVAHLHLAGDLVESLFRQVVEGGVAIQVVADLDQFDLHAVSFTAWVSI